MSWRSDRLAEPTVLEARPADAMPGDAMLWATDEPAEPAHRVIEVGLVWLDWEEECVRVVSRSGQEHAFEPSRVVALLRDGEGPLARSRATDPQHGHAREHHPTTPPSPPE